MKVSHDQPDRKPTWYTSRVYAIINKEDEESVLYFQRAFGLKETGLLDANTVSHLRGLQLIAGIPTTGVLDDATASEINRIFPEGA